MPFKPTDFYTLSGAAKVYNCWTGKVTKFDSSSFYNWEQDNEPVYDLEERTYLNWEHAGFHGSSVPGIIYTVSAHAVETGQVDCNRNIFADVSSAIEALPSEIRFPVLIEVANFGGMGELNLKNIKIGYNGSLEIINRNFAKVYSLSAGSRAGPITSRIHTYTATPKLAQYNLIQSVSAADVSATWKDSHAVHIGSRVLSATHPKGDPRHTNIKSVLQPVVHNRAGDRAPSRLSVGINGALSGSNASVDVFVTTPFEDSIEAVGAPHYFGEYDVSTTNQMTSQQIKITHDIQAGTNDLVTGMMYGNALSSINVQNCDGPIYIRNFFVDSNYDRESGVNVENSNVWIENCASIRNAEAGFNFKNSKVTIARGIAAYRNYGAGTDGRRLTGLWSYAKQQDSTFADTAAGLKASNSEITFSATPHKEDHAYPAEFLINFSRNANGVILENSKLQGGVAQTVATDYLSGTQFNIELNNDHGLIARNSVIDLDGKLAIYNNNRGALLENSTAYLDTFRFHGNQREALKSRGSNIKYNKGLLRIMQTQSPITTGYKEYPFDFSGNGQHMVLEGGSTFDPFTTSSMPLKYGQMRFTHPHGIETSSAAAPGDTGIDSSAIAPLSPIEIRGGSTATFVHPIMSTHFPEGNLSIGPAVYGACISVTDNSKALFKGSVSGANVIIGPNGTSHGQVYPEQARLAGVYAGRNSNVEFNGPTFIGRFGVDVLSEDNSVATFGPHKRSQDGALDIQGWALRDSGNHTVVELHAVRSCLVANRNSTINMTDLGDYNACWDGAARSNPEYDTGATTNYGLGTSSYTRHGSMQFYPNPIGGPLYKNSDEGGMANFDSDLGGDKGQNGDYTFKKFAGSPTMQDIDGESFDRWYYLTDDLYQPAQRYAVSAVTAGGMCVRAVGGSHVNVKNVNFPCGWWNPSGLIYDISGADQVGNTNLLNFHASFCNRLFIWNIADNSRLHASFCSVSGRDPRNIPRIAGETEMYYGPSAFYDKDGYNSLGVRTGTNANPINPAYKAPSATPDTSSLSVLDFFGLGAIGVWPLAGLSSVHTQDAQVDQKTLPQQLLSPVAFASYGAVDGIPKNVGPFRLYVSVDSIANFLSSVSLSESHRAANPDDGYAMQIFAQGYNLSGSVSATNDLSSTWGSIIRANPLLQVSAMKAAGFYGNEALVTSGFIYNNEVVDPTTYARIRLDESAASIFANAKNGAMGTSNRAKICTIYKSTTGVRGEGANEESKRYGKGFVSPNVFDLGKEM